MATTHAWRRTVRTRTRTRNVGKYREIKRTEGVSTTDIVGRLLRMGARAAGEQVREEEETTFYTTSRTAQFGSIE